MLTFLFDQSIQTVVKQLTSNMKYYNFIHKTHLTKYKFHIHLHTIDPTLGPTLTPADFFPALISVLPPMSFCCDLKHCAKFHYPRTTPCGRKVFGTERKKIRKKRNNHINIGHFVPLQRKGSACTPLGSKY